MLQRDEGRAALKTDFRISGGNSSGTPADCDNFQFHNDRATQARIPDGFSQPALGRHEP